MTKSRYGDRRRRDVRDELRDNTSEEAKHLYAVVTCSVKVSF